MKSVIHRIRLIGSRADWSLLVFLLMLMNVKMLVKLAALLLFLILHRSSLRDSSIFKKRFIWFYYAMILLTLFNTLMQFSGLTVNYLLAAATGIAFWLASVAAAVITISYVKKNSIEKLHATLQVFFTLNIVTCMLQLVWIMIDAGTLNPYRYQGDYQRYFINTGDFITGITFDVSTTNALICAFGLVYFLSRHQMIMVLLSMTALLLSTSNFLNILIAFTLLLMFIFQSDRAQKSMILACLLLLVLFLARVTPQNDRYFRSMMTRLAGQNPSSAKVKENPLPITEQPDSVLGPEERKIKRARLYIDSFNLALLKRDQALAAKGSADHSIAAEKPEIPRPSIHSEPFQRKRDTSDFQRKLFAAGRSMDPLFEEKIALAADQQMPGKWIALQQTIHYLRHTPAKWLTGAGTGNFSSKLAYRITGLGLAGGYPQRFVYIHPAFAANHLQLTLIYFSRDKELHSLVNTPHSVYDQLLAEYGIIGLLSFLIFYLAYFRKACANRNHYGRPLIVLLLGALAVEYWFEQLSVIILFELMMLLLTDKQKELDV